MFIRDRDSEAQSRLKGYIYTIFIMFDESGKIFADYF